MRRIVTLCWLVVGSSAAAAEPVATAASAPPPGPAVTCRAMDARGARRAEAQAPSAEHCLKSAQRSFETSCAEHGLVSVTWVMEGELPVTCSEASSLRAPPAEVDRPGRVQCSLSDKEGPRKAEAVGATAAECEERARRGFATRCAGDKRVVTRFSLRSSGDRLACNRPPPK